MAETKEEQRPVMIIGPVGSGKSTLLKTLKLIQGDVKKTESIQYTPLAIDTPGEMMQIPYLYNAFILNSARASIILFLANAKRYTRMPPKIALALKAPSFGVVSQIDDADEDGIRRAQATLETAGLKKIFRVSSFTGEGIEELQNFLLSCQKEITSSQLS
jgi:ethanolamine utilization protein EutP